MFNTTATVLLTVQDVKHLTAKCRSSWLPASTKCKHQRVQVEAAVVSWTMWKLWTTTGGSDCLHWKMKCVCVCSLATRSATSLQLPAPCWLLPRCCRYLCLICSYEKTTSVKSFHTSTQQLQYEQIWDAFSPVVAEPVVKWPNPNLNPLPPSTTQIGSSGGTLWLTLLNLYPDVPEKPSLETV